jgi:hypothetical protein
MAKVIKADGTVTEVKPKNGTDFDLQEVYDHTECDFVQVVASKDDKLIILDEEGKMKSKPFNQKATQEYIYGNQDPIVGTVLICEPSEFR